MTLVKYWNTKLCEHRMNQQLCTLWAPVFSLGLFAKGLADGSEGAGPPWRSRMYLCFSSELTWVINQIGEIQSQISKNLLITKTCLNSALLGLQCHDCIHST